MDPEAPTKPKHITPSVLFICTANQVRSPMAAALLERLLQEKVSDWPSWKIASAGTWGVPDYPAAPEAVELMQRWGKDISKHRSQIITKELLAKFRLVLVMEPGHKEALQVEFPQWARRIHLLSEMVDKKQPIKDPMGGPPEGYERAVQEIWDYLSQGLPRINRLARE